MRGTSFLLIEHLVLVPAGLIGTACRQRASSAGVCRAGRHQAVV
jgi:hypothetical protein